MNILTNSERLNRHIRHLWSLFLRVRLHYLAVRDQSQHSTSVESTATTATLKGLRPNARYVIFVQTVNGAGAASEPSETVVAWTDPIVPAFAEPPAIQPRSGVREGDSITVLCIALGTPTPTVTLYIAGHPIRSTTSRHMVTTIHNVTRLMSKDSFPNLFTGLLVLANVLTLLRKIWLEI